MSSVLLIEPVCFGSNPKIKDNAFTSATRVSESQAQSDQTQAFHLLRDLRDRIRAEGCDTCLIRTIFEPRARFIYADKGDGIFPNNCISFHNFTDGEGKITRRVVILYPMSPYRRDELPARQLVGKLQAAAEQGKLELIDLRGYQDDKMYLEGTGAIVFSYNGAYAYMSRSQRSNTVLFEMVCAEDKLNIPSKNRFCFRSALPRADGSGADEVYHTNVIGWCGKRICAWGLDYMTFDSDEDKAAFDRHLEDEYDCVLRLSSEEVRGFAGNAFELASHDADGKEHRFLCMSETAARALSLKNRRRLDEWYGARNVLVFYGEVVERRTGGSIRCLMCASITHGDAIPSQNEETTLQVANISEVPQ